MHRIIPVFCLSVAMGLSGNRGLAAGGFAELDPRRVEAIAAMLPERPAGFGKPCRDREAWKDPKRRASLGEKDEIAEAEALLKRTFPAWDDAAYLEFSKAGKRPGGEAMLRKRAAWLFPLVVAECLEDRGRFVPRIDLVLNEYAGEKTWTMPAHDADLSNFRGKAYSVDLRSSAFAHELAEALYLLGDKVRPETRRRVIDAIEARVFAPVRRSLRSGKGHFWLKAQHNWNAVCLAGVTGAALAVLPDRGDRAEFVAAAEHYSRNYLAGFTEDGYCSEGTGYWNYGFSNFLMLREELVQATAGRLDLFADPKIRNVAMFGPRIRMTGGTVPCFADCRFGTRPDEETIRYCDRVLGLRLPDDDRRALPRPRNLARALMGESPGPPGESGITGAADPVGPVSYFDKAGVLVCRPRPGSPCRLGAAIKGGGNGNHSHNDVGSFVISDGADQPVGEPGGPHAYDNQTFGPRRFLLYRSLNSFGHPVPVVAGALQRPATSARPKVLATRFTDREDEIRIDIASAYEVPALRKLVRTLRYDREGPGSVSVEDAVEFATPSTFEVALPTHGQGRQTGPRSLEFVLGKSRLAADVETPDGFDLTSEVIQELGAPPFTRLGLRLKKPLTSGTVRVVFRPAPPTESAPR